MVLFLLNPIPTHAQTSLRVFCKTFLKRIEKGPLEVHSRPSIIPSTRIYPKIRKNEIFFYLRGVDIIATTREVNLKLADSLLVILKLTMFAFHLDFPLLLLEL